jgi:hypothetical protein
MSSERRAFSWPTTTHAIRAENFGGGDRCNNSNAADSPCDSLLPKPTLPKNQLHREATPPTTQVVPEPTKQNAATIDIVLGGGRCLRVAPGMESAKLLYNLDRARQYEKSVLVKEPANV